ncbi:MAG: histidinol-phosphatase [Clostridia bacterium]|nr:histidinol-phosphatase [Clostridia bacterium]
MLQNLHMHSAFCDGNSTPEEIVRIAIERGFDSLGFSSHAPTPFGTSCEMRDSDAYVAEIMRLKELYAGRLEIFLGAELDYFSAEFAKKYSFDYTLGGVHMALTDEGEFVEFDHSAKMSEEYITRALRGDGERFAELYYRTMADMPNKISADVVAHFDLVSKFSEKRPDLFNANGKRYRTAALEALHAVRERMEVFEINTGAVARGHRSTPYPAPFLLSEMRALNCKLIISSDCHDPAFIDCHFKEAKEYIKAAGFDTVYHLSASGFVGEKI